MARWCKLTDRTVARHLASLAKRGLIEAILRPGSTNAYKMVKKGQVQVPSPEDISGPEIIASPEDISDLNASENASGSEDISDSPEENDTSPEIIAARSEEFSDDLNPSKKKEKEIPPKKEFLPSAFPERTDPEAQAKAERIAAIQAMSTEEKARRFEILSTFRQLHRREPTDAERIELGVPALTKGSA